MNRKIKFRAWDGEKMISHLYFHTSPEGWVWSYNNCTVGVKAIMQFTGLNDKNGKEIYEGDILDFDAKEWGKKGFVSNVKWDEEEARWDFGGGVPSDISKFRKVIGNIYDKKIPDDYDYNRNVLYD